MLIEELGIMGIVIVILVWVYEGFHLKFLDQVVDEGREISRKVIYTLMFTSGILAGILMAADIFTAGSVLALVLGMILSKKIDHKLWFIQIFLVLACYSIASVLLLATITGFVIDWLELGITFIIVLVGSIADELFHEVVDRMKDGLLKFILEFRLIMKLIVIFMPFFLASTAWFHAVAWISFDISYEITARLYLRSHPETVVASTSFESM